MTTPPPITHAIHRGVTRRPCGLGFIYSASCECGTPLCKPTPDRDAREGAITNHLASVRRMEIAWAKRLQDAADKRREQRARKATKA